MIAKPWLRKLMLTAHVTTSVGGLGAVAVFLALAIAALASRDEYLTNASYVAMDIAADYVIVPLVAAALVIGILQSLTTPWGLMRHYWVLAKLILSVFTLAVLLMQTGNIDQMARGARAVMQGGELQTIRFSLAIHAGGGLFILILVVILSVYKPRGLTPYGWRRAAITNKG